MPESITNPESIVLVVDDEEAVCKMTAMTLAHEDIKCLTAGSVEEALTILKANMIAITLLDWGLRGSGDASGMQILEYCRQHHPAMPVIVMSGLPFDVRTDAIINEASEFLDKPFSGTILVACVKKWLKFAKAVQNEFLPQRHDEILTLEEVKSKYIRHAVQLSDDNISKAAEKLDVSRQTVLTFMKNM